MENKIRTKHTRSAGGVVVNPQGEVLIVRQNGGVWSLPKGHIEEGENDIDAAKREIYEESGMKDVELVTKLGEYSRYKIGLDGKDDKSDFKTMAMFLFRGLERVLKPVSQDSHEAKWVPKGKVAGLLTNKKDKEFFLRILKEI